MGSQTIQGRLWGQRAVDWANFQENTVSDGYTFVLNRNDIMIGDKLLDVGCGSGLFSSLALEKGAEVTGIDASDQMILVAKQRYPAVTFLTGEMEELPFANDEFDVICGFNSYQYAADVKNALNESRRVLKPGGKLIAMIWGNKEDCEASTYLKAIGSLLPPPPPGAAGPFALSENNLLEQTIHETGLKIIHQADIAGVWDYENENTALKGLLSAGPAARAIDHSGYEKVYATVSNAIKPYHHKNDHVIFNNKFRIVIAEK